ncbi:hypothetical protein H6P81_009605 [Aristolochia fimbriata]|uniref:Uncharacterized protein n=1 Tax=Aristolochia fimbriata TaxID=158543 RepID=A0AAV7ELD9_ARIFI|nr:hypothetical protein H6P81_009605 [Aristolochia fimbriata]
MGILLPTCTIFPPPCLVSEQQHPESGGSADKQFYETSSLYSQPSLPSLPSLTTSNSLNNSDKRESLQASPPYYYCLSTLKGHSSYVFSLALAGKFLYSGSANGEIRLWHAHTPDQSSYPEVSNIVAVAHLGAIKSMVVMNIHNNNSVYDKLFTAHQEQRIRVWRVGTDQAGGGGGHHQRYKLLATLPTLRDRVLRYLPPKNHVQVRRHKKCTWVHHVDAVSALALSRDGSTLYSASWDRSFKVWRTSADFACLESVNNAHDDAINAIALSPDGFLYTGSADTKIKVWRRSSPSTDNEKNKNKKNNHHHKQRHSLVATLEKHRSAINALALSSDGSVLYSGACDRSIVVWETRETGAGDQGSSHMAVVGALRGHTRAILCLAVAEDDLLLSGSADKTVRIWRRGQNKSEYCCLGVLEGHRGPVKCLTVASQRHPFHHHHHHDNDNDNNNKGRSSSTSSTGYTVYSGSMDCDIKVWQLSLGS